MLFRYFVVAIIWPAASWAAGSDPMQAEAEVLPPTYQSAFAHYQPMRDEEKTPDKRWREANDHVSRIGGHAGYVKDEQEGGQLTGQPAAKPHHGH